jgi:OmpA-OmpF porin, OOP family
VNHRISLSAVAVAVAMASAGAQAAKADDVSGPYVGAAAGGSSFGTQGVSAPKIGSDESDRAFKVYGGYQINELFGVQAGYVRLGKLQDRFGTGSTTVAQAVSGRSLYVVGTGRLPLGDAFALTGKAGLSFGKTSGTNLLPAADSLLGAKRSLMLGVGAEVRFNRDVAVTVDYERYGKLSNKVKADALFVGGRFSF